jgi:hypothetical protein
MGWPSTFIFSLSALLMCACAHGPVQHDLSSYVNQEILRIAELEEKSLERYAAVTGGNYRSDELLEETLRAYVIPQYGRFLSMLREIRPSTQEVQMLHQQYIRGASDLYSGFRMMLMALEKRDSGLFQRANAEISRGSAAVQEWRSELLDLCKKHHVKVELEETEN